MEQTLNKKILAIALPAIVSNITTPLLGLVDIAIVGHAGGERYIAAVGVGASLFSMVYMLFGFLRMGTAGLTAQCHGRDDQAGCSIVLRRALMIAAMSALVILLLAWPLGPCALEFLDTGNESASLAWRYFTIVIFGAPAVLGTYVLNGWLLGMQNTRIPMWVALMTNVVNIAASSTFVFGLGMKIEGIATGTLISQWLGFIVCLTAAIIRYAPPRVVFRDIFKSSELMRLMKINADIFMRNLCLIAVTSWFTRAGAMQSDTILAANTLLLQFFLFFSYFSDGFAFAGEALTGNYVGSGDHKMLHSVVRHVMLWGLAIAGIFSVVYFVGGDLVLNLLTDDDKIVSTAMEYLPWAATIPLAGFSAFIYDGVFVGMTHTRGMLWSMAVGAVVFIGLYLILRHPMGNHGVWLAFSAYLLARALTLALIFRKNRKKNAGA